MRYGGGVICLNCFLLRVVTPQSAFWDEGAECRAERLRGKRCCGTLRNAVDFTGENPFGRNSAVDNSLGPCA